MKETLQTQAKNEHEQLKKNLSQHLCFLEDKLSDKEARPSLKSRFNVKHYERNQRYKNFLKEAKYSLEQGNTEDGIACIDTCIQAIEKYQKDIVIADNSAAGWELVDKLSEVPLDQNILAVEKRILEQRKSKKQRRDVEGERGENIQGSKQSTNGNKPAYGPCVWCSAAGHGYKYCSAFKADVASGRAVFDTSQRKWVCVSDQATYNGTY